MTATGGQFDDTFQRVADVVRGVPHMKERRARQLTEFITREQPAHLLELGTSHGVSTCYLAAAVATYGGRVTTMDRRGAEQLDPNVFEMLDQLGLRDHVDVVIAERSFTWELMKRLRDRPGDLFDFCFFDGGHTWDVTGYSFLLVDRLLEPGSWVLFDDLRWSLAGSHTTGSTGIPDDERATQQVSLVFDLLVDAGPGYTDIVRDGNWGWARKGGGGASRPPITRSDRWQRELRRRLRPVTDRLR